MTTTMMLKQPGDQLHIGYQRDGQSGSTTVTLAAAP
jgi:hypothetical protein